MVICPVSAGYYHQYRRGIIIPLANTDTNTNTKVLLIRIMPQVLYTTLGYSNLTAISVRRDMTFKNAPLV
jgi:hypothetical protein